MSLWLMCAAPSPLACCILRPLCGTGSVFGLLFMLIELKIPRFETMLKNNVEFMYFPGFRAFFLAFVGTMQWWWWLGITVSVFCFLGAIFNFYVMKTHPAFGHSTQQTP